MCNHKLNGPCIVQFLNKGGEHWLTSQVVRPWGEMSLGGWHFKQKKPFRNMFSFWTGHHLHCLRMWASLNVLLVGFQTKLLCWTMLLSQDKKTRVQWPSLTPWMLCPRRLPAGYCWGSVRSAALCLAGGRQMDISVMHCYTTLILFVVFFNPISFKVTLKLPLSKVRSS